MTVPSESWRVVAFSAVPAFIPILERLLSERRHKLVGLVGAPGPRTRRTDDYRDLIQYTRPGVDLIISNYPSRWADMIRPLRPDLIFVGGFNWKIPQNVLEVPRLGALNGHDSLLPKYRGLNPTGWALRNDEPEFGATFHYMSPEFDTGPILAQKHISITDKDYSIDQLFPRLTATAEELILEALDRIAAGDPGIPQDESQATYTGGAFEPEWREIDWSDTARHTFIKVRSSCGLRDTPRGAFGDIDGQRCLIKATKLLDHPNIDADPGTVLERREDGTVLIQCGDGPLEILEWSDADNSE